MPPFWGYLKGLKDRARQMTGIAFNGEQHLWFLFFFQNIPLVHFFFKIHLWFVDNSFSYLARKNLKAKKTKQKNDKEFFKMGKLFLECTYGPYSAV
jgi:hypothetical protein